MSLSFRILIRVSRLLLAFDLQYRLLIHLWVSAGLRVLSHYVWRGSGLSFRWYLDFAVPFSDSFPLILVPWPFSWRELTVSASCFSPKALDQNADEKAAERLSPFSKEHYRGIPDRSVERNAMLSCFRETINPTKRR